MLPKYIRGLRLKYAALPIVEDARIVRPYLSSKRPLVYLGNLLAYSYLVNLSTKKPKDPDRCRDGSTCLCTESVQHPS
jgi:hypothetical protein